MARRWIRLCAVFFLVGLSASRITLVLHELAGHGGAAALLGGRLVGFRLFLFGGGWVRYRWSGEYGPVASMTVSLAGIGLEIAAAAIALAVAAYLARAGRGALARVALVGFATADLLHAGFYLAAGTHHGFGDGRGLHEALGDARGAIVWPTVAALLVAGFFLARHLARLTAEWTGARTGRGRAAALVAAAAIAALAHGGLTWSERALTRDATYSRIMASESERRVDQDLARLAAEARGLDERELAEARAELARKHRVFPLIPVLAVALALACAAGVWRGIRRSAGRVPAESASACESGTPSWRAIAPLGAITLAALGLVAVLRLFE